MFAGEANIFSAGSSPVSVNPYAVQVMSEIGIDLSAHTSKSIDTIDLKKMDIIITLCADEICPIVQADATHLHWPLTDPASDDPNLSDRDLLTRFRNVRDEIKTRLGKLVSSTLDAVTFAGQNEFINRGR